MAKQIEMKNEVIFKFGATSEEAQEIITSFLRNDEYWFTKTYLRIMSKENNK